MERIYVGVYRCKNKPNRRLPIYKIGNSYEDLIGNKVTFAKLIKVSE